MNKYPVWAWPQNVFINRREYLLNCLITAGVSSVILYPKLWKHTEYLKDHGVHCLGVTQRGGPHRSQYKYAKLLERIILQDEPNIDRATRPALTPAEYMELSLAQMDILSDAGFDPDGFRGFVLGGLAKPGGFLGKYNKKIDKEYARELWSMAESDPRIGYVNVNGFMVRGTKLFNRMQRILGKDSDLGLASSGTGYCNLCPDDRLIMCIRGWDWLFDSRFLFQGIWSLHTKVGKTKSGTHGGNWGLVRETSKGPRLTATGRSFKRWLRSSYDQTQ